MSKQDNEFERMKISFADLQSKAAKQRNEIARLTQSLEKLAEEKAQLLRTVKFMRGET